MMVPVLVVLLAFGACSVDVEASPCEGITNRTERSICVKAYNQSLKSNARAGYLQQGQQAKSAPVTVKHAYNKPIKTQNSPASSTHKVSAVDVHKHKLKVAASQHRGAGKLTSTKYNKLQRKKRSARRLNLSNTRRKNTPSVTPKSTSYRNTRQNKVSSSAHTPAQNTYTNRSNRSYTTKASSAQDASPPSVSRAPVKVRGRTSVPDTGGVVAGTLPDNSDTDSESILDLFDEVY